MRTLRSSSGAATFAACLLVSSASLAQTAQTAPSVDPPATTSNHNDAARTADGELPFATALRSETLGLQKPLGPWIGMAPSAPYTRIPAFQRLPTPLLSISPVDPAMESRFIARRTVGGILLGLSSPFLVTGVYAINFGLSVPVGSSGAGIFVGAGAVLLGGTSFLIGAGLFIPGLVFVLSDPSPATVASRYRPRLQVRPNGVGLSMAF